MEYNKILVMALGLASLLVMSLFVMSVSAQENRGRGIGISIDDDTSLGVGVNTNARLRVNADAGGGSVIVSDGANVRTRLNVSGDDNIGEFLRVRLSNGRNSEVKVMPDTASDTAIARLRLRFCSVENNCTIELREMRARSNVSSSVEARAAYNVRVEKQARIFGIFRSRMAVSADVDAETGEVLRVNKPWWAFLASETNASVDAEATA